MFHEGIRVRKRFLEDFLVAYEALLYTKKPELQEEKVKEEKEEMPLEEDKEKIKKQTRSELLQAFQKDCEAIVKTELDARLVCLTADAGHPELTRENHTALYLTRPQGRRIYRSARTPRVPLE